MRDGAEGGKRIYSIVMFKSCDIKLDAWRSCLRAALNTLQSFSFRKSCFHSCSHELANIGRSKILFFLISFRVNRSTSVVTCIESKPSEQILSSTSFMLYVTKKRNTNHTATSVTPIKWRITVCEDRSRVSGHQDFVTYRHCQGAFGKTMHIGGGNFLYCAVHKERNFSL